MDSNKLFYILNNFDDSYDENKYLTVLRKNVNLLEKLKHNKNRINNQKNWDIAKKFANTYEFIFSFNNDGVSNVFPISRSYFKLIEILQDNDILKDITEIRSACLCEGPGGFIQAINDAFRDKAYLHPIQCITLISEDKKVPNWKLNNIDNYKISYGADKTGNIYNLQNIKHFVMEVGVNSCNLVTADGGFDFSRDFNSQEQDFSLLLLCEIYTCLQIQAEGGVFVVKMFDLFHETTLNIISLLRMFYEELTIHKPKTSRPANSEKYIICKNFSKKNINILSFVQDQIQKKSVNIFNIIHKDLMYNTLLHIYEYNDLFVNSQIFHIEKTLNIMSNNVYNKYANIKFCVDWCKQYNIPIKANWV
jgi:23S rRNA U2552 (ribose-2'-O)-methylase RlmE/FtsJ